MSNIKVFLLGRFSITVDDEDIIPALGNSKKKLSLLQYLLVNKDNQFTNFNLFEHLWSSDTSANPESALKTLVSRLRQDLRPYGLSNLISTKQGVYQWNEALCSDIDIYKFAALANKVMDYTELSDAQEKQF